MAEEKTGVQSGMADTANTAPTTPGSLANRVAKKEAPEGNKPERPDGYYSIHCGRIGKKAWPMNDPFVPETQDELDFCESLVERGYAERVGDKPKLK